MIAAAPRSHLLLKIPEAVAIRICEFLANPLDQLHLSIACSRFRIKTVVDPAEAFGEFGPINLVRPLSLCSFAMSAGEECAGNTVERAEIDLCDVVRDQDGPVVAVPVGYALP